MIPSQLVPLANHLWQSTLFAAFAGLLTLLLRANRPQVRYWLWLSASVKLLIPFSVLMAGGALIGRHTAAVPTSSVLVPAAVFRSVVQQVGEPFAVRFDRWRWQRISALTRMRLSLLLFSSGRSVSWG
jgi:hypothetical protein